MSRILLVSDIHANLAAITAVLDHVRAGRGFDQVWSIGDAIGYGPQPNECTALLRELNALAVVGNHEMAALGHLDINQFNPYAAAAAQWTASILDPDTRTYLESLPQSIEVSDFSIVHGSPKDPIWEYLIMGRDAAPTLDHLSTRHCINGHTHVPAAFRVGDGPTREFWPEPDQQVSLREGRWFVNPGSVGQPRDGDPRASYAVLDLTELKVVFFRVEYPISETQVLMEKAGLPVTLISRLEFGR